MNAGDLVKKKQLHWLDSGIIDRGVGLVLEVFRDKHAPHDLEAYMVVEWQDGFGKTIEYDYTVEFFTKDK